MFHSGSKQEESFVSQTVNKISRFQFRILSSINQTQNNTLVINTIKKFF